MTWDTNPARTVKTTVTVNGTVRPHDPGSISWAQDITSDLPDTVTAGGQAAQRTGSITWQNEGVATRTPSPWIQGGYWTPTVGEPVTIDVTDGTNTYRVFTGVIDTVEGDAQGNRVSKVVAAIRGSNRVVRRLAQTQTGALPEAGRVGRFGTTPAWVVTEIARELGYHSVPPAKTASRRILDAPLQGSTYNYSQGTNYNAQVVWSHRPGYETLHPVWTWGVDGFGVSNAFIEWVPNTGGGSGGGGIAASFVTYAAHAGNALLTVEHGADNIKLNSYGDRNVLVSATIGGTVTTRYLGQVLPAGEGPHVVSVVAVGGEASVRVGSYSTTVALPTPPAAVTRIRLNADASCCVAGVQVWDPSSLTDHHWSAWTPTARYRYGTGTHSTTLTPSIRDQKAGEVFNDYAAALLCPLWVDGDGVLQVVTGKGLHDQAPSLTVDALQDVSELGYTMALLDHRPTVEVTYAHAHATNTAATKAKTRVWQGSGATADPDTPDQTFVNVPDDEEWIGLADPVAASQFLWPNGNADAFYQQEGSWWGFRYENTSDTEFMSANVSQVVETLTPWAWKVTSTTTESNGVAAKTPSQYSTIPQRFRDMNLPIYRARALVRYEDRTVAVATSGASDLDGVLAHDAGKWITTTSAATNLATWVHGMVSTPTPVLDGLRVRFDPRIEVGVKLTVKAQTLFGVDFQALVLSVDHDPGTDTTTVIARVTRVVGYAETLDSVDYAHIGQSLAAWDDARAGRTLDEVAADPYL